MRSLIATAICISLASVASVAATEYSSRIPTQIPAQELGAALHSLAQERQLYLIFAAQDVTQLRTHGATGELTTDEALKQLLDGTGLTYRYIDDRTVSIVPVAVNAAKEQARKEKRVGMQTISARADGTVTRLRMAQAETNSATPSVEGASASEEAASRIRIEEVIVTGSHIRGVQNLSAPVISFDRAQIERTGFATTQQLLHSLPQNLNSISDSTSGALNGGTDLTYSGSGVNLRGLGSDASLVLLNGRRLAAAGQGNFVDLSLIPLSAVERVDVLTDGASAIYGSDAVGGVVNMVLRKDFEGAETRLRYGSVTEGSHDELQIGQALGQTWDSGNVFLSYEYYDRSPLEGTDRGVFQPTDYYSMRRLVPGQERHGALAVLSQRLSERVGLSGDSFFGKRKGNNRYESSGEPNYTATEVSQYGASLALTIDLGRQWQARVAGLFDQNESDEAYSDANGVWATYHNESQLRSIDVTADGPVGQAPGGPARMAIGGQFRKEQFREAMSFDTPETLKREIAAGYAELVVPLVGAPNRRGGVEALEVTLAGRYEDYSDFGSTFNPKAGLAWAPVSGLNVRGTWGTSFKAPQLSHLGSGNLFGYIYSDAFRDAGGTAPTLWLLGNGIPLDSEESTNWTVGFDLTPPNLSGLELAATYFNIDYRDRIAMPFPPGYDWFGVLLDPAYSVVVTRQPSSAQLAALLEGRTMYCYTPAYDRDCANMPALEDITAIVDERRRNLSEVRMSGIDFSVRYTWDTQLGTWAAQMSGTRLLESMDRIVPSAPQVSQMNDVWRPVDLRLRNSVSLTSGSVSAVAFVNYTDSYRDSRTYIDTERRSIPSWTTVDLTVKYDLSLAFRNSPFANSSVTFSAINLFDREPPFVESNVGLNYDGVNANALGRFLSVQAVVQW